ncbi:glycosyltransferase family protein [Leptospira interrogans]|uniref:Acylneuraminate cytidylyltransferase n=2 Tax=Leptospira interrogans TaxID=173 RepID=A0A0M4MTP8_LEPIR|nr:glycosyltransferase family protein [Leptospira interrogans]ALE38963.1 Acylneuraminate cytidylyltransferase [Leptospira interrogans serovar Hardjo str. Norma]EJP14572.1 cytidylyltransferase [Leptospira interrogans str. FPW2026]EKO95391.1 cytidylyltransferase [Leptospira interrogans str. Brem 329]MCD1166855.1 glycosyltransferase family protein [Leptospira interrogans]MCH1886038.1 glycosyltransferase family protein [Leptospira interrogans]
MKVGILIQARMGSTRLPGKIALPFGDTTILGFMLERLKCSKFQENIVVLTTEESIDDKTEEIAKKNGVSVFRGSTNDLIQRYLKAAKQYNLDIIVRLTGDCPLIDSKVMDSMVNFFLYNEGRVEFLTNCFQRTFARGMDVEIFTLSLLEKLDSICRLSYEREHIVPYVEENTEKFKFFEYPNERDDSKYRLTIDTVEDYETLKSCISYFSSKKFSYNDLVQLIEQNPSIIRNQTVHHKAYTE